MLIDLLHLDKKCVQSGRLNPYSNGICSLTSNDFPRKSMQRQVLILILMEYAH